MNDDKKISIGAGGEKTGHLQPINIHIDNIHRYFIRRNV